MDNYKINYIYSEGQDIDDIFIKVLKRELKKYILLIYQNKKDEVLPLCTYLPFKRGKNC